MFSIRYNERRADDIVAGRDPVVAAGASALRVLAGELERCDAGAPAASAGAIGAVAETTGNAPQRGLRNGFAVAAGTVTLDASCRSDRRQVRAAPARSASGADAVAERKPPTSLVADARRLGFGVRRERTLDGDDRNDGGDDAAAARAEQSSLTAAALGKPVLLLTNVELQRLRATVAHRHQTASRGDSQSVHDRIAERLARLRVHFVNEAVAEWRARNVPQAAAPDEQEPPRAEARAAARSGEGGRGGARRGAAV
jgi:hypothetical protein